MTPEQQIARGMQLARECAHKQANEANWFALRAHLELMVQAGHGSKAKPAAWRQFSSKFQEWDYQTERCNLRPDTDVEPLYLAPTMPMTDAQIAHLVNQFHRTRRHHGNEPRDIVRAVETFHRIETPNV